MHNEHFLFSPYTPKSEFKAIDSVLTFAQFHYDGIYIHPFLLPHLMNWLSQTFAIFNGKDLNQSWSNCHIQGFDSSQPSAPERALAQFPDSIQTQVALTSQDAVPQP